MGKSLIYRLTTGTALANKLWIIHKLAALMMSSCWSVANFGQLNNRSWRRNYQVWCRFMTKCVVSVGIPVKTGFNNTIRSRSKVKYRLVDNTIEAQELLYALALRKTQLFILFLEGFAN